MFQKLSYSIAAGLLLAGCGQGNHSSVPATTASAGSPQGSTLNPSCNGYPQTNSGTVTICDHRHYDNLPASGQVSISTSNGDILSEGDGRSYITLDAYVYASGPTEADANNLASQVTIHTDNSNFYATGPSSTGGSCNVCLGSPSSSQTWSVSFAAAMPAQTSLSASGSNGDVEADGLNGSESISTSNGDIFMSGLSGTLSAGNTNGDIDLDLLGSSWQGSGATLSSNTGSITIHAPADYSAQFQFDTTNGTIRSDFSGQSYSGPNATDTESTGHGGPTVKASTTDGDIDLLKKN